MMEDPTVILSGGLLIPIIKNYVGLAHAVSSIKIKLKIKSLRDCEEVLLILFCVELYYIASRVWDD